MKIKTMTLGPTPTGWPRMSSALYYAQAGAAIDWLCDAFGFQTRLRVEGEGGRIAHAELTFGGSLIMVGEEGTGADAAHRRAPSSVGGAGTQSLFVYVDAVEAHLAQARAAGAEIVRELAVSDYGDDHWVDRGYACRDVGGHHWWFAERVREGARYAPRLDARDVAGSPPKGWPRISASLTYRDAAAAIDWLCEAFGFDLQIRVEGGAGQIVHCELVYGGGLVMVSDEAHVAAATSHRKSPPAIGGANTQNVMIYVADAAAHCARARAAGAVITVEPKVSDHGDAYWADLSYEALDPGGHRWWICQRVRG